MNMMMMMMTKDEHCNILQYAHITIPQISLTHSTMPQSRQRRKESQNCKINNINYL